MDVMVLALNFPALIAYGSGQRGIVRVKCLTQAHNAMTYERAGTQPLDLECSVLTIRQPHLTQIIKGANLEVGGKQE